MDKWIHRSPRLTNQRTNFYPSSEILIARTTSLTGKTRRATPQSIEHDGDCDRSYWRRNRDFHSDSDQYRDFTASGSTCEGSCTPHSGRKQSQATCVGTPKLPGNPT